MLSRYACAFLFEAHEDFRAGGAAVYVEHAVYEDVTDGEYQRIQEACNAQSNGFGIELVGMFCAYWNHPLKKVILSIEKITVQHC